MNSELIHPPKIIFYDNDGQALDNGYIYIGQPEQNPEASPKAVYWDRGLTQPAAQPIRTVNGFPSNNGSPSNIFVDGSYSITVRDAAGALVVYTRDGYDFPSVTLSRDEAALISDTSSIDILSYWVEGVLCYVEKDASGTALTTADGQNWKPATGFPATIEHFGGSLSSSAATNNPAMQALLTYGGDVKLNGIYDVEGDLSFTGPVKISGASDELAGLNFTGTGTSGITWAGDASPATDTFRMNGLQIGVSGTFSGPLISLEPQTGRANRTLIIENCNFRTAGGTATDFLLLQNSRSSSIFNNSFNGDAGKTIHGIHLGDQSLGNCVVQCTFTALDKALYADGTSEGILVRDCNMVDVNIGVENIPSSTGEPWVSVANTHINARETCIVLGKILKSIIVGNLFFTWNTSGQGTAVIIDDGGTTGAAQEILISDNVINSSVSLGGTTVGYQVISGKKVLFANNIYRDCDTAVLLEAGASSCTEVGAMYNGTVTTEWDDSGTANCRWALDAGRVKFQRDGISQITFIDDGGATDTKAVSLKGSDAVLLVEAQNDDLTTKSTYARFAPTAISFGGTAGGESLRVIPTAVNQNWVVVDGAISGAGPEITVNGIDPNINLRLVPKGTGHLLLGATPAAITTETLSDYIEVRDAAGNIIKLAIVS